MGGGGPSQGGRPGEGKKLALVASSLEKAADEERGKLIATCSARWFTLEIAAQPFKSSAFTTLRTR